VDEGCGCGQTCDSGEDDAGDAEDALPCNKDLTATQYIENQCCNTSPAKCDD